MVAFGVMQAVPDLVTMREDQKNETGGQKKRLA
jgi:hypothetical protein